MPAPRHESGESSIDPMARAGPPTWLAWGGAVGLVVASALVFCVFDALPFQDLPGHAGLIALRHRFSHSPFEQRYFVFAPELGSYWIFREVGEALVGVIGPGAAVRTLAVLPAIATPAAIAFARARLHGDRSPTGAYFGVALGFGLLTLMGLVSYLFGLSLLIVTLTLWLEILEAADHGQRPGAGREAALAAMACVVWLAHGHAFLLLLAISGITALASRTRWRRLARGRALVPSVALAVAAAWCNRGIPAGSAALGSSPFAPHYEGALAKLGLLVTPTLLTRSGADVLVGLAVWAVIIGASVATARDLGCGRLASAPTGRADIASRAHAKGLLLSIGGVTLAFFALPHEIGWFGFVDGRLVPLILFLAIMAIRRPALGPRLTHAFDGCAAVAASAMVAIAFAASAAFQAEATGWHEIVAAVPSDASLLNIPLEPNSRIFTAHPFVHYDKWVLAERPVVVSDIWFHQGTAIYPTAANPQLRLPSSYHESDMHSVDWSSYRLLDWSYVLIRMRPDHPAPMVPPDLALELHRGGWWLFRATKRGPS
jgi:hypothetical protein